MQGSTLYLYIPTAVQATPPSSRRSAPRNDTDSYHPGRGRLIHPTPTHNKAGGAALNKHRAAPQPIETKHPGGTHHG